MNVFSLYKKKKSFEDLTSEHKSIKTVELSDIKKGEPFISLFPIKPEVLKAISTDMETRGFDSSQPIIIWKERNILIDGHTRCAAAEKIGLALVSAVYESFPDVDSALRYAYGLQFKRRNLSDADRFHFSETYLNNVGQGAKKSGWKKKELAEILSVSVGTAQKYISVLSRGTAKDKRDVKNGDKTINNVYKSLLSREKPRDHQKSKIKENENEKESEISGDFLVLDLSMIINKMDQLAAKKVDMKSNLYANREKIRGISEILPDDSEIKEYALNLIAKSEE